MSKGLKGKRVLMLHFRVGKTDGVSIEMDSWRKMLEEQGKEVRYCAGPESINAEYVIEEMEQQLNNAVYSLDQEAFGGFEKFQSEKEFISKFNEVSYRVEVQFQKVIDDYSPTDIIISNIFCVGEGLPVAKGLLNVLDRYKSNTILINHDFYWEESRYDEPSCDYVRNYLDKYLTPDRDYIRHCTINSIGQKSLKERKGIDSVLLYDTFDFNNFFWKKKNSITDLLNDYGIREDTFVFLQATRVVRRKNIELSIDIVRSFQKRVYDKGILFPYNKVVLLLAGYVERRDSKYLDKLIKYANEVSVDLIYIGDRMHEDYELFDIYPYGHVITYPSEYEGFGNQLLEAFNIGRPIIVFEYPVFKTDIKNLGFEVISLGDSIEGERENGLKYIKERKIEKAVDKLLELLEDKDKLKEVSSRNKKIADENFGYAVTKNKLIELIQ